MQPMILVVVIIEVSTVPEESPRGHAGGFTLPVVNHLEVFNETALAWSDWSPC